MQNVYKKLSAIITDIFIKQGTITEEKKDVYSYGFEILISNIVYISLFIAIAIITNTLLASFVFFIGFYIYRTIAGGFHADTYIKCHILFMINHLLFILTIKLCPIYINSYVSFVLTIVSSLFLFFFAPVEHPNKPFIKNERKRFRKFSCIHAILLLIISPIILMVHKFSMGIFSLSFAIGSVSAAISLMSAKFIYKKGAQES